MMSHVLERTTFETSRLMEFFTEKELAMQIGSSINWWPVNLLKELVDNALDACESAGIAPEITISVEPDSVSVRDNGPGLPISTLEKSLDYLVRVSDKNHYVSPTRGQLGNALKCVWAAPFVANTEHGRVDVITGGDIHQIDVTLDRIAQRPNLNRSIYPDGLVKNGTLIKIYWPEIAGLLNPAESPHFYKPPGVIDLVAGYSAFNPHATFKTILKDADDKIIGIDKATDTGWQKWQPNRPTSPHWYGPENLRSLIAAYISAGRGEMTVREFISEFDGLKGTQKQKAVTDGAALSGAYLNDLVDGGDVAHEPVIKLLNHMQRQAKNVNPKYLGVIGQQHFTTWLAADCDPESVKYKKITGQAHGLPFVIEAAFGLHTDEYEEIEGDRTIGLNWSATLKNPIVELSDMFGDNRIDSFDPVEIVIHIACPRFEFTSRGKDRLDLPQGILDGLESAVKYITKDWKAAKRQADKENRLHQQQIEDLRKAKKRLQLSIKDAGFQVMEQAYMHASANNTLPANARQIMYAARPLVLELTGGKCWKNSSYFTQNLLPNFIDRHEALTDNWDVVYDARGKLIEPHRRDRTSTRIDLGTLAVRRYIAQWTDIDDDMSDTVIKLRHRLDTTGPANRYKFALFIEKEGFNELLESVRLADQFDLAIMSTKGMSVTAARELVAELSKREVTILVLHDFDKAGFSIIGTLKSDTRRWQYEVPPNVVDLGLRLADIENLDLQSEPVYYRTNKDPRRNLRESGATEEECNFLVNNGYPGSWQGKRVELNAMTSTQLIDWLKEKLSAAGCEKVIPSVDFLESSYRNAKRRAVIQKAIDDALRGYDDSSIMIPDDLYQEIERGLKDNDLSAWDDIIFDLAKDSLEPQP